MSHSFLSCVGIGVHGACFAQRLINIPGVGWVILFGYVTVPFFHHHHHHHHL